MQTDYTGMYVCSTSGKWFFADRQFPESRLSAITPQLHSKQFGMQANSRRLQYVSSVRGTAQNSTIWLGEALLMKVFCRLVLFVGLSISPMSGGVGQTIRHGIFFGECAGYCVSEIEVSGTSVLYKARYIGPPHESLSPEKTKRASITTDAWNQLLHSVQESEFLKLKDRYGCPDCADQGGEWIEIRFSDRKVKKVTFDYDRPPIELLDIVKNLQAIQETFSDKPGVTGSAGSIPNKPSAR